jgi:hypothetical protein
MSGYFMITLPTDETFSMIHRPALTVVYLLLILVLCGIRVRLDTNACLKYMAHRSQVTIHNAPGKSRVADQTNNPFLWSDIEAQRYGRERQN